MVEQSIINLTRRYLQALPDYGIHASRAVIFGSFASGTTGDDSDIDLLIVAPEFDLPDPFEMTRRLWLATGGIDDRIEPIPCGESEWSRGSERPIVEMARDKGFIIEGAA